MKHRHEDQTVVETVLRDAYRQAGRRRVASLDDTWKADVLRQIRTQPDPGRQPPPAWLFQQYLWRLAPVAGLMIVFMAVWLARGGLSPDIEMAALTLNNPANFNLIEILGL
ncbi:hypothetical protein DSCA_48920 [Desulfosarcina alkanivorans]|jgi:hypothetical protein|uniref:Uncharacterized protein n=1 Tax=Desulfosarcina alkanivorans TaxID=571177 RepID=A0A5K7YMI6_9BACT|nr:hypothetical protein [Desulfosarcina alkanivorans]BBO70962.1 hypothetical protein DSCA_48920 [Desulfosarcina alkanivorans]